MSHATIIAAFMAIDTHVGICTYLYGSQIHIILLCTCVYICMFMQANTKCTLYVQYV